MGGKVLHLVCWTTQSGYMIRVPFDLHGIVESAFHTEELSTGSAKSAGNN